MMERRGAKAKDSKEASVPGVKVSRRKLAGYVS